MFLNGLTSLVTVVCMAVAHLFVFVILANSSFCLLIMICLIIGRVGVVINYHVWL